MESSISPGGLALHAVNATRALALGGASSGSLLNAVAWILGILAVVIPLPIHRYRRITQ